MAAPLGVHMLLFCALVTIGMQLLCFLIAYACAFDKITDFSGGTNFILLAVISLVVTGDYTERQWLVTGMLVVSRLELAVILLVRVLKRGKDARFDEMRHHFFRFLGFWVFQMIWVYGVSVSVIVANTTRADEFNPPLEARDYAGLCMFVVGFIVQVWADVHKFRFRADPANKGHLCRSGVWAWSRHPNYFGEILLWWGIWTSCTPLFDGPDMGGGYATVVSPLLTMAILLLLSGMPIAERDSHSRYLKLGDPLGYCEYRRVTSILIPLPPALYGALPWWVKAVLLFEWPMFDHGDKPTPSSSFATQPASLQAAAGSGAEGEDRPEA